MRTLTVGTISVLIQTASRTLPGNPIPSLQKISLKNLKSRVNINPETADADRYFIAEVLYTCTSPIEGYARVIVEDMAFR